MDRFTPKLDTMIEVTLEELQSFHSIDREIFARLVINRRRHPGQSMLVVATWLWLEEMGYPNLIFSMRNLSDDEVNAAADEALACLAVVETGSIPSSFLGSDLMLTSRLMERNISLNYFMINRLAAIDGIIKFLKNVCARAFVDILQRALVMANLPQIPHTRTSDRGKAIQTFAGEGSGGVPQTTPYSLDVPGFPHPIFGVLTVEPQPMVAIQGFSPLQGESSSVRAPPSVPEVPPNDRTLFVTFSRGYSVTETEVRDFFNGAYGDCVEIIYMQDVPPRMQPLFARVVLRTAAIIPQILGGQDKMQVVINGKHVRVRRYVHDN